MKGYLENFDIIALQETWLEKEREKDWKRRLNKDYEWTAKPARREKRKGRAMGGVMVGIKKEINKLGGGRNNKEWGHERGLGRKANLCRRGGELSVGSGYRN